MATKNIVPRATGEGGLGTLAKGWGGLFVTNTTTSSATEGGKLTLSADDGAVMADNHRLGVIEFKGAEDTSSTLTNGARIQCIADAAWSASENGASLQFYTTDANASESVVLTLDSNKLATFAGAVSVAGNLTFDSVALTGIQTSAESFVDNDISLMTSAAIDDRINAVAITNHLTNNAADTMAVSDFGANAALFINADQPATAAAEDSKGLHIDYDRIVAGSGTANHNDIGIDLDVTSATLGTGTVTGMDIDVVGATSGTHTAIGIDLDVDSADTNIGMQINTAGTHMKLVANADADDYATLTVADTGDLIIATVGDGSIDSDLTLDADGQIKLEPVAGKNILLDGTIAIDAGVVTGATSITSTAFVGDITGDVTGNADTSTKVTVGTGSNSEYYPIPFYDTGGGNLLRDDSSLHFNPGTDTLKASKLEITGNSEQDGTITIAAIIPFIFEGATADDFETSFSVIDPTADRTIYLPNLGGYIPLLNAATTTAISATPAELNVLDGVTAGTVTASLGVVVDGNKDIGSFRNLNATGTITVNDATASSATEGGALVLASDDGAALADGHRLGVIEFKGAEDGSGTLATGARIECVTENGAWSGSNNAANLNFYTASTNGTGQLALSIDGYSNSDATFRGDIICNEIRATQLTTTNFSNTKGMFLDCDTSGVGAQDATGMHIDFDRSVAGSGTAAHNDIGLNLDVTSASLGTSTLTGMDIDVVGTAAGTSTAIGINLDVDTADTNIGMIINTAGTHMKLVANADVNDYATITVADTGDLNIVTVGSGTTDSDMKFTVDGKITMAPASITGDAFHLDANGAAGSIVNIDAGILDIDVTGVSTIDTTLLTLTSTGGEKILNVGASGATKGGTLVLCQDDDAVMASGHRLGVIEFKGAEDAGGGAGSNTLTTGARIEALCDATWSASENGADLVFYTTDGNASESEVMRCTASTGVSIPGRKIGLSGGTDGAYDGDVVYFGGTTSMTVGTIYHYKSDGTWEAADADAVATSDGLLAVALGAASDTNGMLLRGMVTLDHDPGAIGDVLFLSTTAGDATATAPSGSADIVRVIGYQVNHASQGEIWFNPDSTYVELA